MIDTILDDLNEVQCEAVVNYEGASLIIAGAGSGKTRVLTYRIAYLLSRGVAPQTVLALTFTNKAAREMKERISNLVGPSTRRLWIGTFHSIFARILRTEAEHLGYTSAFTIYDTTDSRSVIKSIIKEMNLDENRYKPANVLGRISMVKNNLVTATAYQANGEAQAQDAAYRQPRIADIYKAYAAKCKNANAMDFDDLLLNTNILFHYHPDVLEKYQRIFRYILVDEYQDTNTAQYLIVKKLTAASRNICVVGDDAQSIYSFRGARIENILNFKNDYPEYKEYKLEQNYRSTQTIVNAANSVIEKNRRQLKKHCFSEGHVGEKISVIKAFTDQEEGFLVASSITDYLYREHADYNHFAILYRTNAQSRIFEDALRKKNIPYKIYGGLSFYQRAEIKDAVAYLRLIVNPNDDEAFKRIINYPTRGIGDTTLDRLQMAATQLNVSLWTTMNTVSPDQMGIRSGIAKKMKEFASLIDSFKTRALSDDAYQLAYDVIKRSGMLADLRDNKTPEGVAKYENIEEFLNSIKEFIDNQQAESEETNTFIPITQYLENIALVTDADTDKPEDRNKVMLMTIHSAKGLEFNYVYIVGMEETLFPGSMSSQSEQDLEEERRLFYVAVTRAAKKASVSYAQIRYRWGNLTSNLPSRFLREIDAVYLDNAEWATVRSNRITANDDNTPRETYSLKQGIPATQRTPQARNTIVPKSSLPQDEFIPDKAADIQAGMEVEHKRFGTGKVISIEGNGSDIKAIVNFYVAGQKTLLMKFAQLRIVK
ncbi:MAG: UvrD-helicase domain-containing protein [Prevotellaceae bacterium]|jgi:DNA helicase-2/ATP-dependent DNA helicase PcrA|nr:UvrD-helicase domain-containing protein [Prevotellaceae bacterium]